MRKQTIAVSATFTSEPIEETLAFWMHELNLPFAIEFAPYNQVFQQLLDPSSLLSSNEGGINVVMVRFEDWDHYARNDKSKESTFPISRDKIERNVNDLTAALKSASERTTTPFLVCICPASDPALADADVAAFFRQMEEYLVSELEQINSLYLISSLELDTLYPVENGYDARSDELGHIPFTPIAFAAIGTIIARRIYALRNTPHKVVVLDCDQTLWKGVVGEDGVSGIEIDPARRRLQEFIVSQNDAGMLVCLCSKNNDEDVAQAFKQRSDMPLTWDRITSRRINWKPKSENIRELAEELNLGLDSFIFIDDDPVVCAEVRANSPGVLTVNLPQDASGILRIVDHVWAFDRLKITAEDKKRAGLYKQNTEREILRKQSVSFEDFLAGLSLDIRIFSMSAAQLARVSQLTHRTNQFNFTTLRRSESEIQSLCQTDGLECMVVEVSDRFGDYGLVGVMMFRPKADSIDVDTFLLSCRTLGRGVEHRMLARIGELAEERGCAWVNVSYLPTKKNQPALDFLESIGGEFKQETESGYTYQFPTRFAAGLAPKLYARATTDSSSRDSESNVPAHSVAADNRTKSQLFERIYSELYAPEQILEAVGSMKRRMLSEESRTFTAPTTKDEIDLVKIWEDVLAISPIGTTDNFFDLGGTSVIAVRLFSDIEKVFGKSLSLAALFEAPTIAQLAVMLRGEEKAAKWSSLVPIQPKGFKPPLFCVHAAGGNVLFYRDLANRLGTDQPFYGLQALGLDQKKLRHNRVEEMASHYIEEIRKVQPEGPYHLGGACFGGLVVYEMAQQLQAQGQKVALVALFNTNGPGYPQLMPGATALQASLYKVMRRVEHHWESLIMLSPKERLSYLSSKAMKTLRVARKHFHIQRKALLRRLYKSAEKPLPQSLAETQNAIQEAQKHYTPKVYSGKVTIFRASKQPNGIYPDPTMGWGELVAGGLEIHEVTGYHAAIIAEPRAQFTATILQDCLKRAQEAEQESPAHAYATGS